MLKFIFRIAFFFLGLFILYIFGGNLVNTFRHRAVGISVEGRIIGFSAGRNGKTPMEDPTGVRKGKTRARRPFFRYPTENGATDSLTNRSDVSTSAWSTYAIGDKVTVVFAKNDPQRSYIFGSQILFFQFLLTCFGLFLVWLGIRMKL